jgi:hypothetical protein
MLGQLTGVDVPGESQRAPEGATPLRQREASRTGMQLRSPTRQPAGRVRQEPIRRSRPDRDEPQ